MNDSVSTLLKDVTPVERGLFSTLRLLFTAPGKATREWLARPDTTRPTPMQIYLAAATVCFGVTSLIGEVDTGALYVFGGGVFGKIGKIGVWIAFLTAVPVLNVALWAAFRGGGATARSELAFTLHFEAVVLLGISLESALLVALPGGSPVRPIAAWSIALAVAVYYFIALKEHHRLPLAATIVRGAIAAVGYLLVFAAAVILLATLTDFRL